MFIAIRFNVYKCCFLTDWMWLNAKGWVKYRHYNLSLSVSVSLSLSPSVCNESMTAMVCVCVCTKWICIVSVANILKLIVPRAICQ